MSRATADSSAEEILASLSLRHAAAREKLIPGLQLFRRTMGRSRKSTGFDTWKTYQCALLVTITPFRVKLHNMIRDIPPNTGLYHRSQTSDLRGPGGWALSRHGCTGSWGWMNSAAAIRCGGGGGWPVPSRSPNRSQSPPFHFPRPIDHLPLAPVTRRAPHTKNSVRTLVGTETPSIRYLTSSGRLGRCI